MWSALFVGETGPNSTAVPSVPAPRSRQLAGTRGQGATATPACMPTGHGRWRGRRDWPLRQCPAFRIPNRGCWWGRGGRACRSCCPVGYPATATTTGESPAFPHAPTTSSLHYLATATFPSIPLLWRGGRRPGWLGGVAAGRGGAFASAARRRPHPSGIPHPVPLDNEPLQVPHHRSPVVQDIVVGDPENLQPEGAHHRFRRRRTPLAAG